MRADATRFAVIPRIGWRSRSPYVTKRRAAGERQASGRRKPADSAKVQNQPAYAGRSPATRRNQERKTHAGANGTDLGRQVRRQGQPRPAVAGEAAVSGRGDGQRIGPEPAHAVPRQPDAQPWRNRLIWGDKKYVLPALLEEFAGKVNLIYIDPPFDTGADFSFTAAVPDAPEDDDGDGLAFTKEPSVIEQKAYRDTWGRGMDSYLQWFYETVTILHELLAENGSIYVHLDWHDRTLRQGGPGRSLRQGGFRNEIIWKRTLLHSEQRWRHPDIFFLYESTNIDQHHTATSQEPTWNTTIQTRSGSRRRYCDVQATWGRKTASGIDARKGASTGDTGDDGKLDAEGKRSRPRHRLRAIWTS